jgi:DNA-binding XRE family transcriptional regulator
MRDADRLKLLYGPYRPPKVHRGSSLFCEIRGTVIVGGFRDGEIPWPWAKQMGRPAILCGDLIKAVQRESGIAISHHFGISTGTVKKWRQELKVPRRNEGSARLWRDIALDRTDDRLSRARENSKTPAARDKIAATLRSRPLSPALIEGARRNAKKPRTESWKKKMSEFWRKRALELWKPEEDALLGTDTDANIARKLNRKYDVVFTRRCRLGIPPFLVEIDGKKLRRLRKKKGFTQHGLAAKVDAYRDAVINVELGTHARLRRDLAQRIADVLGCDLKDIERRARKLT